MYNVKKLECLFIVMIIFTLVLVLYSHMVFNNLQSTIKMQKEEIEELKKDKKYYQNQYNKYYQWTIEYEQKNGVYRNEP